MHRKPTANRLSAKFKASTDVQRHGGDRFPGGGADEAKFIIYSSAQLVDLIYQFVSPCIQRHIDDMKRANHARLKPFLFGIQYVMNYWLRNKCAPLIRGLVLTNQCNLNCRHCHLSNRGEHHLSFAEAVSVLRLFHEQGGRCLYFEGGEPFLWKDREWRLEDLVRVSRQIGFLTTILYTNGTFPLVTSADTVFVSVDGLENTHNELRGNSFNRIIENLRRSTHPSLYVNFTINRVNQGEIEDFCRFTQGLDTVRGVFFYFHTPYYGEDDLCLNTTEKSHILRRLLAYRKRYRILNSRAGLLSALRNDWPRPLPFCDVYESGQVYACCRYSEDPELCARCGYLSYPEIYQTLRLKPSAMLNAVKYF